MRGNNANNLKRWRAAGNEPSAEMPHRDFVAGGNNFHSNNGYGYHHFPKFPYQNNYTDQNMLLDSSQPPPVPMAYPPQMRAPYQFHKSSKNSGSSNNNPWSSDMTAHSRLIINNDPQNLSHLSPEDKMQISFYQAQIDELKNKKHPKKPLKAYEIFENKNFNSFKNKYAHQSASEINQLIVSKWQNQITKEEQQDYEKQAKELSQIYHVEMENNTSKINAIKKKIHEIRFPFLNGQSGGNIPGGGFGTQIKPSGKIKFMSAYRFFRKEMVPVIKQQESNLDGKGRHAVVHDLWTQLQDRHKLAYVLMSRADREKSLYIIRLNQIREELKQAFPTEFRSIQKQENPDNGDEKIVHNSNKQYSFQMHGFSALEQINEKINEEYLSQDNENSESQDEFEIIPNIEEQENQEAARAEHLKQVNMKRAQEVQRVTQKILKTFQSKEKGRPVAVDSRAFKMDRGGATDDIAECLLQPPTQASYAPNDSIFSQSFIDKNDFVQRSAEEIKHQI